MSPLLLPNAATLFLAAADTRAMASLGGRDLYPDPLAHASNIRNLAQHPFEFYQKMGFGIVGLIPDANGLGKPDIFIARRLTGPD